MKFIYEIFAHVSTDFPHIFLLTPVRTYRTHYRMMNSEAIIDRFGGTRAASRALGIPPSTIQSWKSVGQIPVWHHDALLKAGERLVPPLKPSDFFDCAPARRKVKK